MSEREARKSAARDDVVTGSETTKLQISIGKGHVRRAIQAAEGVFAAGRTAPGGRTEAGFVLMTAILLVERLANAAGCEPLLVLSKMADCFKLKQAHTRALRHDKPS